MSNPNALYVLPPLPFGYADLEPIIDEATMRLHHDKHHQAYVDGTNAALSKWPQWRGQAVEEILRHLSELPPDIRDTVRNQGGGFANHSLFWRNLTPVGAGKPGGEVANRMSRDFGSYESFKKRFIDAGLKQFGSGWVFLTADPTQDFKLDVVPTANQDSVLSRGLCPLLACDVWEHAYYLKYTNRRGEWLNAWWDVVNWETVSERLSVATAIGQPT